jgi:disulfide bond formation protein DsbB
LRIAGITIATSSVFGLIALACAGLLAFGLYLQHVVGLNPCPMCIVQRYAMIGLLLLGLAGWWVRRAAVAIALALVTVLLAGFGAFVAARQSWLQWYPPEAVSCGRDFYGMIENFPIGRAIPMIFKGSGDCTAIDWTFLGGTIANWSFVWFVGFALTGLLMAVQAWRQR